jgi:hypothetical protein
VGPTPHELTDLFSGLSSEQHIAALVAVLVMMIPPRRLDLAVALVQATMEKQLAVGDGQVH